MHECLELLTFLEEAAALHSNMHDTGDEALLCNISTSWQLVNLSASCETHSNNRVTSLHVRGRAAWYER